MFHRPLDADSLVVPPDNTLERDVSVAHRHGHTARYFALLGEHPRDVGSAERPRYRARGVRRASVRCELRSLELMSCGAALLLSASDRPRGHGRQREHEPVRQTEDADMTEPILGPSTGDECSPMTISPASRSLATLAISSAGSPYATSASGLVAPANPSADGFARSDQAGSACQSRPAGK